MLGVNLGSLGNKSHSCLGVCVFIACNVPLSPKWYIEFKWQGEEKAVALLKTPPMEWQSALMRIPLCIQGSEKYLF